ncbi:hypothetical protein [Paraburkholderia sp.]|jgi:hypothetical protein|uniref:hypothetical protein n=1 Tax=Paraburkholderia sp. TaxID=1926495 RepID=UPI002F4235AC
MKPINYAIPVMAFFGGALDEMAVAAPSLCKPPESVVFSCSTTTSKNLALCVDKRTRALIYRFGRPGKIEMRYSANEADKNGFFYNHYFRSDVDYTRIAFVRAGYEYSVFRNYDATASRVPDYGVAVSRLGGDEAQIKCQSQVVDNMSPLLKQLRCDESSALGCS